MRVLLAEGAARRSRAKVVEVRQSRTQSYPWGTGGGAPGFMELDRPILALDGIRGILQIDELLDAQPLQGCDSSLSDTVIRICNDNQPAFITLGHSLSPLHVPL